MFRMAEEQQEIVEQEGRGPDPLAWEERLLLQLACLIRVAGNEKRKAYEVARQLEGRTFEVGKAFRRYETIMSRWPER